MPSKRSLLAVFDTETTGLPLHPKVALSKQPKIIEIGIVLIDMSNGKEVDSFCEFVNPMERITPEITKITGIVSEDVAEASTFLGLLPKLQLLFKRSVCVTAHNLPFDKLMVENELARHEMTLADFGWPAREFCTAALYTPEWGRMPRLVELYKLVMGKPLEQTHRALDDARALAEIVIKGKLYELA